MYVSEYQVRNYPGSCFFLSMMKILILFFQYWRTRLAYYFVDKIDVISMDVHKNFFFCYHENFPLLLPFPALILHLIARRSNGYDLNFRIGLHICLATKKQYYLTHIRLDIPKSNLFPNASSLIKRPLKGQVSFPVIHNIVNFDIFVTF